MFIFYFSNLSPAVPLNSKTKIIEVGGKSGAATRCFYFIKILSKSVSPPFRLTRKRK